jgi:hypothetical protein
MRAGGIQSPGSHLRKVWVSGAEIPAVVRRRHNLAATQRNKEHFDMRCVDGIDMNRLASRDRRLSQGRIEK